MNGILFTWTIRLAIAILLSGTALLDAASWWKTYGGAGIESPSRVARSSDGSYYIIGQSRSFHAAGQSEIWVVKLNAGGDILWQKSYGTGLGDAGLATPDGGLLLAGSKAVNGGGNFDFWIAKLNRDGIPEYQRAIGGTGYEKLGGITPSRDGGYFLAGHTFSFGAGKRDLWVVRISGSGAIVWQKTFGGSGQEFFGGLQPTPDGGVTLLGSTDSYSNNASNRDICVLRLSGAGQILWQKVYAARAHDILQNAQRTPDGGLILIGSTRSSGEGQNDLLAMRLNSSGSILWQKTLGGPGRDEGTSVNRTPDGGFLMVGTKNSAPAPKNDAWVVKTSSSGAVLWQKVYGGDGNEVATDVKNFPGGGYLVFGRGDSVGAGRDDSWGMRLEPDGLVGSSCQLVRDTVKPALDAVLAASSLNFRSSNTNAQSVSTSVTTVDTNGSTAQACVSVNPNTVTWSVRLTKDMFAAAGYTLTATEETKLQNTTYSIRGILNGDTDRLVDGQKCSGCHTGTTSQSPARYLPHFYPFGPATDHWQNKTQSAKYRWNDASSSGILYYFRNANVTKPDALKAIIQKWLDDGALP